MAFFDNDDWTADTITIIIIHFVIINQWGAYARDYFEPQTATGSELFPYLTCLHTTTFILFSVFHQQSQ